MNERIRELAKQADGPNPFYGTLKNQMTLLGDDAVEKFALLIVRECTGVCDDERDSTDSEFGKLVAEGCALKIMERFGVLE